MMKIKDGYKNFIKAFLLIIIIGFCLDILSECSNEIFNIRNLINTFLRESIWFEVVGASLLTIILYKKVVEEGKIKKSILNEEIWNTSKIGLIIGTASLIISRISLERIEKLISIVSENVLLIYIIITAIVYVKRNFIYKKVSKKKFLEIILNTYLYTTYLIMFIVSIYGVKYFVLSFQMLMILNIIRLLIKGEEPHIESKILYKEREYQLEAFDSIMNDRIIDKVDNNYAVALCGEWGSGKSEFLKTYINREKYRDKNYFIYIKPMIRCSIESLMNQFSEQLKTIMKEQQIYHSIDNIERYFREVLKIIGKKTSMPLDSWLFKGRDKDNYLSYKEKTQKSINELVEYGHKRLVVIIDDFDRLDEEYQELVLSFVKEIVDFHNCITVFGLDLSLLKNNEKITPEYLEKFVDRKFNLYKIPYEDLLEVHGEEILSMVESENEYINELRDTLKENSYNYYEALETRLQDEKDELFEEIERLKNNGKNQSNQIVWGNKTNNNEEEINGEIDEIYSIIDDINEIINNLENGMINSRRVIHFFDEVRESLEIIERLYCDNKKIMELLRSMDVGKIIYYINFIKVFREDLYSDINECGGIDRYRDYNHEDYDEELIKSIIEEIDSSCRIVYNDYTDTDENRLKCKNILRFIDDMFFDGNFIRDDIEFEPQTVRIIDCFLKERSFNEVIDLEEIDINLLMSLQNKIDSYCINDKKHLKKQCIKFFMDMSYFALENELISNEDFISLIGIEERNEVKYCKEYLGEVTKRLGKLSFAEKRELDNNMNKWLQNNIHFYSWVFYQIKDLLEIDKYEPIISRDNLKQSEIDEAVKCVLDCLGFEDENEENRHKIKKVLDECKEKEARILIKNFNEYINNYNTIKSIINFNFASQENDENKEDLDWVRAYGALERNDYTEIKKRLEILSKKEKLDKNKTEHFSYLLGEIQRNLKDNICEIDYNLINNVRNILEKVDVSICSEMEYSRLLILAKRLEKMKEYYEKRNESLPVPLKEDNEFIKMVKGIEEKNNDLTKRN